MKNYKEWLEYGVDYCELKEEEFVKTFSETFDLNIDKIPDCKYFKLCFIAEGKIPGMACFNTLDDYRKGILHYLIEWYRKKLDEDYDWYDPDWAEDVKTEIKEVFC